MKEHQKEFCSGVFLAGLPVILLGGWLVLRLALG
jgi:hypothetical protein